LRQKTKNNDIMNMFDELFGIRTEKNNEKYREITKTNI